MRVFVGMDGDDIGATLISLAIKNQAEEATRFGERVIRGLQPVGDQIHRRGGRVLFIGGDNLMAEMEFDRDLLHELQALFQSETGCGATIGVGKQPVEAYLALRLGKGNRKSRIVCYEQPSSAETPEARARTTGSMSRGVLLRTRTGAFLSQKRPGGGK